MQHAPLIVGFGGINAAGRSSGHHAYKRIVHSRLGVATLERTYRDLAVRMGLAEAGESPSPEARARVLADTLVRDIAGQVDLGADVRSAGMLPTGFDPGALYRSRNHPRGLRLAVYAISDALASLGVPWERVVQAVAPDEISVYAASSLGQVDALSLGGLIGRSMRGERVSSKMLALSFAEMPADFTTSYALHTMGATGGMLGACATFLYNLRQGMLDIQSGRARVAVVGAAEAPLERHVAEGFAAMGALATVDRLRDLDGVDPPDWCRACRPFSTNVGLTLGESAQYVVLMADRLALDLGANVLGLVADVYVNADGRKRSISEPGIGNYVTVMKAGALARAMLAGEGRGHGAYVQAHGTGTPQNRITESRILDDMAARMFDHPLPVTSIKSHLGHSLGAAGGDQLGAALGAWHHGLIPGIGTIDHVADDVTRSHLDLLFDHREVEGMDVAIVNSKGFGGNNASAVILSPALTGRLLERRHGRRDMCEHAHRNEAIAAAGDAADMAAASGREHLAYAPFGRDGEAERARVDGTHLYVEGRARPVELPDGTDLRTYFSRVDRP